MHFNFTSWVIMVEIFSIIAPIYMIVLIGYLTTRFGLFNKADMRTFGKFVVNLALPGLLFKALSERHFTEIINGSFILAYAIGSLPVIGIGFLWGRRIAGQPLLTSTFYSMGMATTNSGYIGYPILLLILPSVAAISFALLLMVENLLTIPLLLTMAEYGSGGGNTRSALRKLLARLVTNPLMLALMAGMAASLFELQLPKAVAQTVNILAASSGALSLFVIGGTLVGLPVKGMGKEIAPIVIGKLIMHPLCVLLAIILLPVLGLTPMTPILQLAVLLMAATPMTSIYASLAQQYGLEDFCSVAQLLTTITSFFTLSGLLWLFQHFSTAG